MVAAELLLTVLGDTPAVRRILDDDHFPELVLAIRHAYSTGMDLNRQLPVIIGTPRPDTLTAQTLTTAIRTQLRTHPDGRRPSLFRRALDTINSGTDSRRPALRRGSHSRDVSGNAGIFPVPNRWAVSPANQPIRHTMRTAGG